MTQWLCDSLGGSSQFNLIWIIVLHWFYPLQLVESGSSNNCETDRLNWNSCVQLGVQQWIFEDQSKMPFGQTDQFPAKAFLSFLKIYHFRLHLGLTCGTASSVAVWLWPLSLGLLQQLQSLPFWRSVACSCPQSWTSKSRPQSSTGQRNWMRQNERATQFVALLYIKKKMGCRL